jgi:ferrochelatase
MQPITTIGILLMAYGSPDSLDDLEPYLLDIRNGRPVSPALLAEIKDRYALIGGRSPLLDLTRAQASELERELNQRFESQNLNFRTFVGMRHWQPRIREAVAQIKTEGINQLIALVLAPHSSLLSTGAYFARLQEAIDGLGVKIDATRIESWHDHPGLIIAFAEKVRSALWLFAEHEPFVIFTAHSLPARILETDDPYASQLHQTAALLAKQLGLPSYRWTFCYQSAGQSPEPWLGPSIDDCILDLIHSGYKNLLVVPVGFVCDHVEVLYDIDVAARRLASAHGARLERSESLNTSPIFISALADLVTSNLPAQVF